MADDGARENLVEPEEPQSGDCCGEGCSPCVWDTYREKLKKFHASSRTPSSAQGNSALSKIIFTPFTLIQVHEESADTKLYKFQVNHERTGGTLALLPGQHLELRQGGGDSTDEETIRKYSPIDWCNNTFDVIIKMYTTGKMSAFVEHYEIGTITHWRGPYGNFKYNPSDQKLLLMLCMGTGIAPMIPVIRSIVEDCEDETLIRLLCGSRTLKHRLLLGDLKQLASYWNFSFTHHVSSDNSQPGWGEQVVHERIGPEAVQNAMSCFTSNECRVLICGTDLFTRDMKKLVTDLGVSCYCF